MTEQYSVLVGIDSSLAKKGAREFDRSAKKVSKSSDKMAKNVKKADESFTGLGNSAFRLKRALGIIGVTGITAAFVSATRSALEFSGAMDEVSTLIDDTFDPANQLTDTVKELSKEFAQSPVNQAKALYQVISAGATDAADATETLTAANKLAVGGVTDVATAADGLTSVMNAYAAEALDATEISDAMFVAMKAGKTTIGELSGAIGLIAPIAAQTGVSMEELLGGTAALTKSGLSTSQAMTGMRQAIANILKPTKQAGDVAERLKIEFNAVTLQEDGFLKFMQNVATAAKGNKTDLTQLFGSVEAVNAVLALTSEAGGADFVRIMEEMKSKLGATDEAVRKITEGAAFQADKLKSQLTVAWIEFGEKGLRGIGPALTFINENFEETVQVILNGIAVMTTVFVARLMPAIVATTVAFIAGQVQAFRYQATLASMAGVSRGAATSLGLLSAAARGASVAMAALGGPAGVIFLAVAALAAYLTVQRDVNDILDETAPKVNAVKEAFEELGEAQLALAEINAESTLQSTRDDIAAVEEELARLQGAYETVANAATGMTDEQIKAQIGMKDFDDQVVRAAASLETLREREAEQEEGLEAIKAAAIQAKGGIEELIVVDKQRNSLLVTTAELTKARRKKLKKLLDDLLPLVQAEKEYAMSVKLLTSAFKKGELTTEQYDKAIAKLKKTYDELVESETNVKEAEEKIAKARKSGKRQLELLRVAELKISKAIVEHRHAVEDLKESEEFLALTHEERVEWLERVEAAHRKNIEVLNEACESNKELRECTEDSVTEITKLWERGLENIQDAFAEAFRNIFTSGENFFDGILDAFKDMISNMLAEWAASGILDMFKGGGGGGFNIGSLFGGGGGGGGGFFQNIMGMFSGGGGSEALTGVDVFNMGRGGIQGAQTVSAAGSTAVGGTGMFANTPFIGAFTAAFTAAGGFAGGLTGAASSLGAGFSAGFASIPVIGWILAGAALNDNLFAKGFQPNTGDLPKQFGFDPTQGGIAAFEPFTASIQITQEIDKALQKLGVNERIASLIGGSAGPIAQFGRKAPRAVASGLNLSVADGKIIAEGFVKTVASGGIFRSSKRKFKTTELDEGFIESLQNSLDALLAPFEQLIDVMGGNTDELKSFNIDTERLRLQEFTKKGKPKFSDEEISEKLEVFLRETVHDAVVTFLRNTDSLAEEFKQTVLRFSADTEEMLMALQLVTSISNNLNANFVADIQEAQAMATRSGTQALADNIVILREAITAYDGSMESLINLESAYSLVTASQFQLIGALLMVKDGVEAMFNNTRNAIAEAGLDDETLYNMRSDRIDELTVQLSEAIDPTEIAAIADEINRLTISSFGLLDEGQQLEMKDDFLTFLDDILMLTNERIDAGIAAIEEDAHTLNMEVSGAMQGAADTQVEAANDFRTGVNDFRGGVRDFRDFVRNGGDRQFGGDTDNVQEVRP